MTSVAQRPLRLVAFILVTTFVCTPVASAAGTARPRLTLRWSAPSAGEASYLLADARGAVAVGEGGQVTALARDGSERWTADVGDGKAVVFHDYPSMSGELVVVPANEEEAVALDRRTGALRWRAPFVGVKSSAVGAGSDGVGLVGLANRSGSLVVLDAATGETRWSAQLPAFYDDPVRLWFGSGRLLVQWTPTDGGLRLAAFDVATASVVWSRDLQAATLPSVLDDSVLFAATLELTDDGGRASVQSLDLATGAPRWEREFPTRSPFFTYAASAAAGRSFAVVDLAGQVRLFDADDGTQRWKHATGRKQYEADPRIAGDVVAMSTYGTGLVSLSAVDGEPVETGPIGGVQYGVTIEATAAAGDRLYLLVSRNGEVRDEAEVWAFSASR